MTETGEKWALSIEVPKKDAEDFEINHIIDDAEFWIRAFCDEVGRRAVVEIHKCGFDTDTARWKAFIELRSELLGEESK